MINKTPKKTAPPPPPAAAKKPAQPAVKPALVQQSRPPATLISSYKKKQQVGPFIIWGIVILLVFIGLILLGIWLMSPTGPVKTMLATETPTVTVTASATSTNTATATATETVTPTITASPTPDKPFPYTVVEGDTLDGISTKFNLGLKGVPLLLLLNPTISPATLRVGDVIIIPNPGLELPTATPIPDNLPRGTKLEYTIQAGDTIAGIASLFNSTEEDILKENGIEQANNIQAGQVITVRVNLVTPTASPQPTIPPGPSVTPPSPFTPTPPGGAAPATLTPTSTP
jgi:LysM repeat protein